MAQLPNPKVLFLDDVSTRIRNFSRKYPFADIVKTADKCIEAIKSKRYDIVQLDHDLGGEAWVDSSRADTGMEVVRFIEEHKPDIGKIIVHSWNTSAGPVMVDRLIRAGYPAIYRPFKA